MNSPLSTDLVNALQAKYPNYKVISEPDPDCTCKGTGERTLKPSATWPNGHSFPCMCVCLSGDHRVDCVRAVGLAAARLKNE